MMNRYQVMIQSGAEAGKIIPVDLEEMSIGRERGNHIVINDVEVSRKHAVLKFDGQKYILEDHGSTNGTFVNGVRLTAPYPLRGGEVISLGENASLLFEAVAIDPDATVVSSSALAEPKLETSQLASYPPPVTDQPEPALLAEPVYAAPVGEVAPSYAGQIPEAPVPPKRKRFSALLILAILGIIIVCCGVTLFIIDSTRSWCYVAGWFFNAIDPGACP